MVVTLEGTSRLDAAVRSPVDGPAAAVVGDTVEFNAVIASGGAGSHAGRISLMQGASRFARRLTCSTRFASYAERTVRLRTQIGGDAGARRGCSSSVLSTDGDALATQRHAELRAGRIARGASAVFVHRAGIPRRLRATPSTFCAARSRFPRAGTFAWRPAAGCRRVRSRSSPKTKCGAAFAEAPLAVLARRHRHFRCAAPAHSHSRRAPRSSRRLGRRKAIDSRTPSVRRRLRFSLRSAACRGIHFHRSSPAVRRATPSGVAVGRGDAHGRMFDERPLCSGKSSKPRRVVVVRRVAGLWRWRISRRPQRRRVHRALPKGSVFDWLTGDATDARAAHPVTSVGARRGEPVRWRRGSARDTMARPSRCFARRDGRKTR